MKLLAALGALGAALVAALFRRGGPYNPIEDMNTDHETVVTFTQPEPEPPSETHLDPIHPLKPHETPVKPSTSPLSTRNMLDTFCHAIAQFEGANPANNNPGNCRCSPVGYLPKYGNVTCNPHNFSVFPTYALGWEYLTELVHHRAVLHPTWTIRDFFFNYAPPADSNPSETYAKFVAARCGVAVDKQLKDLFA